MENNSAPGRAGDRLGDWFRYEFQPRNLIPNLIAGLVVSIIVVIVSVSLATLIFSGKLSSYLPQGISIMLFSGVLITGIVALVSSYPGMIAYPQERVAPILAVIAAFIVGKMSNGANMDQAFYTVVAAITVASLSNGIFLSALGFFKLGGLIRFIPYPVIGGFLAGTGWLLVRGSLGVMTGFHIHLSDLPVLFETQVFVKWIAGVGFGLVMVLVTRRFSHYLTMPALLLGAVGVFFVVLLLFDIPVEAARSGKWLLGPFPESEPWKPLSMAAFSNANWQAIAAQSGNLATILLIAVVSVLLNSGALELVAKTDIDLNRELKTAGAANILIALGGGTVGFHSLSISRLVHKMGAKSRLVGIVASLVCALLLFLGPSVMANFPRFVLGGLLFFLGMHFLIEWVYDAWFRMTKADYAIVIMILIFVAAFGYLHGVGVGIIACIILFLINYSKVNVVKLALSGVHQQSNVDRPARHFRILHQKGEQLYIFKLQGYIFFGTANGLLNQVRNRLLDRKKGKLRFMVLDFKNVSGIDSSSTLSFIKMRQLAEKNHFTLIFTHLSEEISRQLEKEDFDDSKPDIYRSFIDLDRGIEWCENKALAEENIEADEYDKITLHDQLAEEFPEGDQLDRLLSYFERKEVAEGHCLIKQNTPSDDLYLIEKGQVTASLRIDETQEIRLRTMRAGTIVGELGLILSEPRSATVVADRPSVVYRLTARALDSMKAKDPDLALSFQRFLSHLLAERLVNTDKAIQTLLG